MTHRPNPRPTANGGAYVLGMVREIESTRSEVDGIPWEIRPEWLAGSYWWRIYVTGHTKVLMRNRENAIAVASALAADEAQFRREKGEAGAKGAAK